MFILWLCLIFWNLAGGWVGGVFCLNGRHKLDIAKKSSILSILKSPLPPTPNVTDTSNKAIFLAK